MAGLRVKSVYQRLYRHYGPQGWWPGDSPFEIMVGAVLTQNTSWRNVEQAIDNLKQNEALDPRAILDAHPRRLASWLKPSGYFNVKAKRLKNFCRWYLQRGGYTKLKRWPTPALRAGLLSVNGVGAETADDMLLYAFDRPVFVVDAYTRRILKRLELIEGDEDYETLREGVERRLGREKDKVRLFNEYHALIVRHGKDICRPKPRCHACCLAPQCKFTGD
jgi:endonuclease-3 related protein